jgi:hypothetical protein
MLNKIFKTKKRTNFFLNLLDLANKLGPLISLILINTCIILAFSFRVRTLAMCTAIICHTDSES